MKLHLPTGLRAALLAAVAAVSAHAEVPYTGTVYTWDNTTSGNDPAFGRYAVTTYDAAGNPTVTTQYVEGRSRAWTDVQNIFASTSITTGNTMRFDSSHGQNVKELTYTFFPFTVGGFIVEKGAEGYSINSSGSASRIFYLGNNSDVPAYSEFNEDFSINKTSGGDGVVLRGTQTWQVASGATFTLQSNNNFSLTGDLTTAGDGLVSFTTGNLNVAGGATLTFNSDVSVAHTLTLDVGDLTAEDGPILTGSGSLSIGGLTLDGMADLAVGSYTIASTTNANAETIKTFFTDTEGYKLINDNGVLTLSVQSTDGPIPVSGDTNLLYSAVGTRGYEITHGTLKIGNANGNGAGSATAGQSFNYGPITVKGDTSRLQLWSWTATQKTLLTSDKVGIASGIALEDGGMLYMQDGSYHFSGGVSVKGSGEIQMNWGKGVLIEALTNAPGTADNELTFRCNANDGSSHRIYGILSDGDFSGSVNLANQSAGIMYFSLGSQNALQHATVNLGDGSHSVYLALDTADVNLKGVSGAGTIGLSTPLTGHAQIAASTLHLTGAGSSFSGNIGEGVTLAVDSGAGLTLTGTVGLYNTITCEGALTLDPDVVLDLSHLSYTEDAYGGHVYRLASLGGNASYSGYDALTLDSVTGAFANLATFNPDGTIVLSLGAPRTVDWDANWGVDGPDVVAANLKATTALVTSPFVTDGNVTAGLVGSGNSEAFIFGVQNGDVDNTGMTYETDVWIEAAEGSYRAIVGGSYCNNWNGGGAINLEGDTHIQVDGATVGTIVGGNLKDGKSPQFTGSSYISVLDGDVTASIIGSSTNSHNKTTTQTGDTNIFVYVPLSQDGVNPLPSGGGGSSVPANHVIGASAHVDNTSGSASLIGSTHITIDLSGYTGDRTEFVKSVVGGHFSDDAIHTQTIDGNTNVTIKGGGIAFSGDIIGGNRNHNGSSSISGKSTLNIEGGIYSGTITGGSVISGNATSTIGNVVLNLGGDAQINGNVYAAGVIDGSGSSTVSSTTVNLGAGVEINGILSGDFGGASADLGSVSGDLGFVYGDRTLKFTDAVEYNNLSNAVIEGFDELYVADGGIVTINQLTIIDKAYPLDKSGDGTLVLEGTDNVLFRPFEVHGGKLVFNGTFVLDGFVPLSSDDFVGGDEICNGFYQDSRIISIFENVSGNVEIGENAHFMFQGEDVKDKMVDGSYWYGSGSIDYTTFYVNEGTEKVSTAQKSAELQRIVLSGGTSLKVDADIDAEFLYFNAQGQSYDPITLDIVTGSTLSGTVHLENDTRITGSGTYALDSGSVDLGSTLDNSWGGTVRLTGNIAGQDWNPLGNSGSWVELNGVTGYARNSGATTVNINLRDTADGTPAFTSTALAPYVGVFSGKVAGDGTWVTSDVYGQGYEFSGDISGWTGEFRHSGSGNATLTLSGSASAVNAEINRNGGTLTLVVGTNDTATFSESVDVSFATINSSAAFNADTHIGRLGGSGSVAVGAGASLSLAASSGGSTAGSLSMGNASTLAFTPGAVHADTAILTLDGTFTQSGALTISLAADGMLQDGCEYLLLSLTSQTTPASWNSDLVTVTGLGAGIDNLSWNNGGLYFTYNDPSLRDKFCWTGSQSVTWNTSDINWTYEGQSVAYGNGVDVAFGNDGSGWVELEGELAPASVLVDNGSGHDYTFAGSGKLTGDMQLTKDGSGTLYIATANDYTGGTVLSGGTLVMWDENAFGTGPVIMNGGTLDLSGGQLDTEDIVFTPGAEIGLRDGVLGYHWVDISDISDISIKDAHGVHADWLYVGVDALSIENSGDISFSNGDNPYDTYGGAVCVLDALNLIGNGSVLFAGNSVSRAYAAGGAIYCGYNGHLSLNENDSLVFDGNSVSDDCAWGGAIALDDVEDLQIRNNGEVVFTNNRSADAQNVTAAVSGSAWGGDGVRIQGNDHVLFRGNGFGIALGWHNATLALSAGRGQSIEMYDMMYVDNGDVSFNSSYRDAAGKRQRGEGDILISGRYLDEDYDWEGGWLALDAYSFVQVDKHTTHVDGLSTLYAGRLSIEDGAVYEGGSFAVAAGANATLALRNASMVMIGYYDDNGWYHNISSISGGSTLDLQGVNSITAATLDMQSGSTLAFTLDAAHADTAILTLDGSFNQGGLLTISLTADGTLQEGDEFLLMSLAGATTPASWKKPLVTVTGLGANIGNLSWEDGGLYFTYGDIPLPDKYVYNWTGASSMIWNTSAVNWTHEGQSVAYSNGKEVVFDNTGIGGEVELQGELSPVNVLVDNDAEHGYTFTGSGKLTGDMLLTKAGTGTLTINTENDYTGGTLLSGGTLVMGNENAFGTGPVIMNGGTLDLGGGHLDTEDIVFTPGAEIGLRNGVIGYHMDDFSIQGASGVHVDGLHVEARNLTIANSGEVSFTNSDTYDGSGYSIAYGGAMYGDESIAMTDNETLTFSGNSFVGYGYAYGGALCSGWADGGEVDISRNGSVRFVGNSVSVTGVPYGVGGGAIYGVNYAHLSLNENDSLVFDGNSASGDCAYGGAIAVEYAGLQILNNGEVAFTNNRSADAQHVTAAVSGYLAWHGGGACIQGNDHVLFRGNGFGIALTMADEPLALSAGRGQSIEMYDMMYVDDGDVSLNSSYTDAAGNLQRGEGDILISGKYLDDDYDWDVGTLIIYHPSFVQVEKHTTHVGGMSTLYAGRLSIEDGAVYEGGGFTVADAADATLALRNASMVMLDGKDVGISGGSTLAVQGVNSITAESLNMADGSTLSFTLGVENANEAALTLTGLFNQGGALTINLQSDIPDETCKLISMTSREAPESWDVSRITLTGDDTDASHLQWEDGVLYYLGTLPRLETATWSGAASMAWNTLDKNWTQGEYSYRYRNGVNVVFDNTGAAGEVELTGKLAPLGVLVDNDAEHGYAFTGSGKLTGDMQLTKEGAGTLSISTANDYTGGTVLNGGTLATASATALGGGDLLMQGGRLRVEQDLTLEGQITVDGLEDSSIEVADGAVLHLSQAIINDGFIRLSGDIDISALEGTPTGTTYYGGGQTQGNGFLMTECETLLIECGLDGDFDWSGAEIHHSGNTVVKEDWGGVIFAVPDTDTFYILKDTESVSTAHSFTPDTRIVMSAGTTLNVDADISLSQIQANGAATIDIDSGSVLTGYATGTGLTLAGDGVYALESGTTLGSLSLGSNWTGTVRLTGSASGANFNSMARTGSRLELNGVYGYPTTYSGTTTADIILTDTADGTAAFTATYGNSYNYGYNMKFTGAIQGEGSFVANAGANRYQNYELAGDVSGWRGEFRYASGQDTVLTVSGNAHEVNAAINGGSGLTLQVKTDSAFGAAVSAGSLVLNGGSATFNDSIRLAGGISASGTSTLAVGQGQTLSLGTAISNSGSLTLRGTFDVSGHESELIGSEYSGGAVSGNGFGATLYGVHAVQNSGSATLDWSQATVLYDAVEREKRADGSVVLSRENDGMFHVLKGTESVGTAQDAAAAAGITMQGIELQDGTTLEVDRDFSTEPVSVVSGSAYLNVMAGATLQSNGEVRDDLSLKGDGTFKLAAGSTQEDISWDGADWHGTVLLSDVAIQDLDLNEFGHAGSKVGLDGVSGNFARPGAAFAPTLVLTGDGLQITACYTGASYTFAGGVEGDGTWIYGLTGRTHNQTYVFTGDMSRWTGAYESVEADKTSTLKFYGDAAEMGADIRQTAGTVNVEVGNGSAEHTTAFKGEVEASSFTVRENATAVLENKATVTGSVKVDGTLEVAEGGSLALAEAAAMSVGNAYTVTGQGGNAPAFSGNIKADAFGFHGTEDHTARIDNAIVDLQAEASVVFDNVILGATSRLTDDPATVVANNLVIEGRYGVNVQEGEPMTIKSGSIMQRLGQPSELIELDSDATACRLDITNVENVSITGNCLTIDLSGMYPALYEYSRKFDWLGISLGSGDQVAALDTNMVVELKLNDRLHPRAYYMSGVGWGGTDFVMPVANGENVGMIYVCMFDVPEPATSTLSLLALAALAARRRRKH